MKQEMTKEQAYQISINKFNINDVKDSPDMLIETPRGVEVSAAFVLYCKDYGYFDKCLTK